MWLCPKITHFVENLNFPNICSTSSDLHSSLSTHKSSPRPLSRTSLSIPSLQLLRGLPHFLLPCGFQFKIFFEIHCCGILWTCPYRLDFSPALLQKSISVTFSVLCVFSFRGHTSAPFFVVYMYVFIP